MTFTQKETLKDLAHKARLFTSALLVSMEENLIEMQRKEDENIDSFTDRKDYFKSSVQEVEDAYNTLKRVYKFIHTEL